MSALSWLSLWWFAGCDDPDANEGAGDFCARLGGSPGCSGEAANCREGEAVARASMVSCRSALDALLGCLEPAELSCVSEADFNVYAATGSGGDQRPVGLFASYLLTVRGSDCAYEVETWRACMNCGGAVGFGGNLGGIADPCGGDSECSEGLVCDEGACTEPCSPGDSCLPRHGELCVSTTGRSATCHEGWCRPYCFISGSSGYLCPPSD